VDNQPYVAANPHGPEVIIFRLVDLVEILAGIGGIKLQVERRCLSSLLLLTGQTSQAISKRVGNEEFHIGLCFISVAAKQPGWQSLWRFPFVSPSEDPDPPHPKPTHDDNMALWRFVSKHLKLDSFDDIRFEYSRPIEIAFTGSCKTKCPQLFSWFNAVTRNRCCTIFWVGQKGGGLRHQCVELTALSQKPRQILFVGDSFR
jgi:hypothetical protein